MTIEKEFQELVAGKIPPRSAEEGLYIKSINEIRPGLNETRQSIAVAEEQLRSLHERRLQLTGAYNFSLEKLAAAVKAYQIANPTPEPPRAEKRKSRQGEK